MPLAVPQLLLRSDQPNYHILYGALVEGPGFSDFFADQRSDNSSRVVIDNNAGFQSALAGLEEAPGSWEQCLQVGRRRHML